MRVHAIALLAALRHQPGPSRRYVALAFSSPALGGQHSSRRFHRSCPSLLSSATAGVDEAVDKGSAAEESSPSQDVVLVRRNRQSMAFRSGSPLVFSGAIESTFSLGSTAASSGPDMGSLVLVSVSPKKDSGGDNKKSFGKDRRRGGRGGRGGGGGRGGDSSRADIPHKIISDDKSDDAQMIKQAQDIGVGVYNPSSMYRVRILCHTTSHGALFKKVKSALRTNGADKKAAEQEAVALILQTKLHESIQARLSLNLPSDSTDSYRLVNGEGDGLSGLAVDVLGGKVAVVMSSAAWVEIHKESILKTLDTVLKKDHLLYSKQGGLEIVWRNTPNRLKQDGYQISEDSEDGSDNEDCVVVTESNVLYHTYPYGSSQKTGFYCDQRDNRLDVAKLCENKRVLDLCCYNGGFALNAMVHGGALSCIGVDSSQDAIDAAIANAELNGLDESRIQFMRDDIAQYMKNSSEDGQEYDVIVLDPPKLAPSASGLERASRKYHALNRDAMKIIDKNKGGLLLTCTCSGAMTQKDGGNFFLQTVQNAALSAGRQVTLLRKSGAAPCHTQSPASYPAGNYLTAALFYVGPESK